MKKWLVTQTNYGHIGRYCVEGDIVELDDNVVPDKRFFKEIKSEADIPLEKKDEEEQAMALSALQKRPPKQDKTAGEFFNSKNNIGTKPMTTKEKKYIEKNAGAI